MSVPTNESLVKTQDEMRQRQLEREERERIVRRDAKRSLEHSTATVASAAPAPPAFDWHHAPLDEALAHLADLRRAYDRCAAIVLTRQSSSAARRWTCFTQLHKDIIPPSVQRLCKKSGDDGKWASRDDGVYKIVDGIKVPDPQFCCSAICHEYYLKSKPISALSRH